MQRLDKIQAIKALRNEYGWELKHAKDVCDIVERSIYALPPEMESTLRKAQEAAECAQEDLRSLVRLVDYLVARPAQYEAWKRERGIS